MDRISQELAKSDIIYLCLNVMKYVSQQYVAIGMSLLSKLIFNAEDSKNFAKQFVTGGGLSAIMKYGLLDENLEENMIVDTLSLVSQLARISKEFYEPIHAAGLYECLNSLIVNPSPQIRSKVCNLIGNLCRHTSFFYDKLLREKLIDAAIQRC